MKPNRLFLGTLCRFRRLSSEAGQALIFGALTLFMLAAFVMFAADSGMITSTRVEMQNAADECTYAGALYEANVISSVAYLNEAMAWMYYDALRYAVDTSVTGVLNALKHYRVPQFKAPEDKLVFEDGDSQASGIGGTPQSDYDQAYNTAKENIPKIENSLNMFGRWEWGMALACGELVDMEMNRVALRHNVEAMAVFPDVRLTQRNAYQLDLHILKRRNGAETIGWRIWTNDTNPPFYLEAVKLGLNHWLIEDSKKDTYEIEQTSPTTHHIVVNSPSSGLSEDITVQKVNDDYYKFDMVESKVGPPPTTTTTHVEAKQLPGLGWAVSADDGTSSVSYQPLAQGGYQITVVNHKTGTSGSAGVRQGPNGRLQQWNGSSWADVPGQPDTVNVGGVNVQVSVSNKIDLDPSGDHLPTFTVPNQLQINSDVGYTIPNVLNLPNIIVVMRDDGVQVSAQVPTPVGTLSLLVDESNMDKLTIYGLLHNNYVVPDSADCKWHPNRDGTERDRLCRDCQLDGDCSNAGPAADETNWTYQFRRGYPYFIKEVPERFAHHAIWDREGQYPQWAKNSRYPSQGWYDVANGWPNGEDYWQIRKPWPKGGPPNHDKDGDGKPDSVRIRILRGPDDLAGLTRDDTRSFDPYYTQVEPWGAKTHDVAQNLVRLPGPIRLSEDFFYYALTVGCWRSSKNTAGSPVRLFSNPRWGVVAFASARAGFLETRADSPDPNDPAPHFRFTWPTTKEIRDFVESGYEDLYEPIWTAHLWPMTDAIKDEHIGAYVQNQTGLSYLVGGLLNAEWFEPQPPELLGEVRKIRDDVPPLLRTMGLNPDDPRLNDVIHH